MLTLCVVTYTFIKKSQLTVDKHGEFVPIFLLQHRCMSTKCIILYSECQQHIISYIERKKLTPPRRGIEPRSPA